MSDEYIKDALRPFADKVFNDNGDMTVSDIHLLKHEDFVRAYFAYRRADLPAPDPMDDPRVKVLVQALQVFSDCADILDEETRETGREYPDDEWAKFRLLVSDYRRARAALAAVEPD